MNQVWTKTKPEIPGYYWSRFMGEAHIVKVVKNGDSLTCRGYFLNAKFFNNYEWAGPIPEPEEQ